MLEITIKEQVYQFNFGMGFLKEINRTATTRHPEAQDVKMNIGLRMAVIGLLDRDVEELCKVLMIANKGQKPRLTEANLDYFIDNECKDIDAVFDEVIDFLKLANATKSVTTEVTEAIAEELERRRKIAAMEAKM